MKTISRYIMTLALLLTAVGGAWAQDYYIDVNFNSSYDRMETIFHCTIMSMDPMGTVKGTLNLSVDGVSKGSFNVDNEMYDGSIAPVDAGDHTWAAVFRPEGGVEKFDANGDFTIDKLSTSIAYNGSTSINMGEGESTELEVYVNPDGTDGLSYSSSDASVASIAKKENSNDTYIIQAKATGTATITFSFAENTNYKAAEEDVTITVTVLPAPIKVTTDAAEEGATFTEASFAMPAYDATADYELVRDMQDEAKPVAFTGLPTTTTDPIIVKKGDDGKYQPIKTLTIQLIDPLAAAEAQNIIAADGITIKVLVGDDSSLPIEYDQDNPITLEAFLADMKPGYYWIKAEPTDENSPYDGTVYSSEFTVVEQYDLLVKPANDFSKGKVESVTVGSGSVTIDANGKASKTGIDPETEVKIKAKRGYVIDKVEVKKGIAPPDPVTVTWNNLNFNSNPYTRDGVTLTTTGNAASANNFNNGGDKTFTTTLGKFTKIEIVCESNNFNGWAKEQTGGYQVPEGPYVEVFKLTWTGNAESVTIPGGNYLYGISSITFTIQ